MTMPTMGHRKRTNATPPKKAMMPRMRSLREKNRTVRDAPMVRVRPVRKRMSPRARRVESKRKRMPRKRKVKPRNIRPVPILVLSDTMIFDILDFCRLLR